MACTSPSLAWRPASSRALVALVLASSCLLSAPRRAEATPKEEAAILGDKGLYEYQQGKLVEALLLFQQAHSTAPSVTFQLYEARCLTRLGRIDEASRLYDKVAQTPVDERVSPVVLDAVATAERERESLRAGKQRVAPPAAPQPPPPPHPDGTAAQAQNLRKIGWIGVGVGAATMLVGVGFALSASSQRDDLDARCQGDVCPPQDQVALEEMRSARTTSRVSLVLGGAFLAAGASVLFLVPRPRDPKQAYLRPAVFSSGAGLVGAF